MSQLMKNKDGSRVVELSYYDIKLHRKTETGKYEVTNRWDDPLFAKIKFRRLCKKHNCLIPIESLEEEIKSTITHEEKDEQGRRHCLDNYAVCYSDGKKEYWVHGVQFSKELFNNIFVKKNYNSKQILAMKNAEQKGIVIKLVGLDYILDGLEKYDVIDEEELPSKVDGKLLKYQVIEFDIATDRKVRVVKVQDHTTGKTTCLGVPIIPQTHFCRGAIAWTFGMDMWDYNPEVET